MREGRDNDGAEERGEQAAAAGSGMTDSESSLATLNEQIAREQRIATTLESKSFARVAWERYKRNTQAVAGTTVVLLLAFVGIFAPLLANNLPYSIETTRPDLYRTSANVVFDDGLYALEQAEKAPASERRIDAAKARSLRENHERMIPLVGEPLRGRLSAWWGRFESAALGATIPDIDAARTLLEEFDAAFNPDMVDEPIPYVSLPYYPAFRSLSWNDVGFMAMFVLMIATFPLRSFLFGGARRWLLFGAVSFAVAAGLWRLTFPPVSETSNFKRMVEDGWAKSETVRYPPIPYGENENRTAQAKEPPAWFMSPEKGAERLLRFLRYAGDASRTPAAERDGKILEARALESTAEFQANVPAAEFLAAALKLNLHQNTGATWQRVDNKRREATLQGTIMTPSGDVGATLRMVVQRGNWRLLGMKADGGVALGEFSPVATENDYHWLGTDGNGRDLMSRMIHSTRIAMSIGVVAVSIYSFIGIVLGALAGYFGGKFDLVLSRIIEIVICFPVLFLLLIVVSMAGSSPAFRSIDKIFIIMVVIGLISWTDIARLVRGEFLRLTNEEFVQAIRAVGGTHGRIIFKHILPNALGPVLVAASFGVASAILYESALSFIGLGVTPPTASWGTLLNQAREDLAGMWWMTLFPGAAIFVAVTCFNLLGEGVRDALDPKAIDKH